MVLNSQSSVGFSDFSLGKVGREGEGEKVRERESVCVCACLGKVYVCMFVSLSLLHCYSSILLSQHFDPHQELYKRYGIEI